MDAIVSTKHRKKCQWRAEKYCTIYNLFYMSLLAINFQGLMHKILPFLGLGYLWLAHLGVSETVTNGTNSIMGTYCMEQTLWCDTYVADIIIIMGLIVANTADTQPVNHLYSHNKAGDGKCFSTAIIITSILQVHIEMVTHCSFDGFFATNCNV